MLTDSEMTVYQHEISKIALDAIIKSTKFEKTRQLRIDVFVCRVFHDMTFKEIGQEFGIHSTSARIVYYSALGPVCRAIKKRDSNAIF
jgi:hypothetical protein